MYIPVALSLSRLVRYAEARRGSAILLSAAFGLLNFLSQCIQIAQGFH